MSNHGADRLDAASPRMLILSVSLHLLALFLILAASFSVVNRVMPRQGGVTRVTLMEEPGVKPVVETISRGPVKMQPAEAVMEKEMPTVVSDADRKIVDYKASHQIANKVIPLKKRKASPQRVESAKSETPKNTEPKTVQKKADSKDFLEQRLAAIRKEVEKKRNEQLSSGQSGIATGTPSGGSAGVHGINEEFVRWFDDVRGRINSHWSVFGDNRKMEKFAVIGIRLSDDGRLIEATVDETSGDPVFDKSAMRAIFLASPFPPVPTEIREKIRQAGGLALRFSPGGMQ